jgi:AraC-like DNA-binding protein
MSHASLPALDWALRGGTVALTLLIAVALLRALPGVVSARLGVLFAIGAAAYAIVSASGFHGGGVPWQIPLLAVSAGNNTVFWLFASVLFDDTFRLRWWHGVVWLVFVVLGTLDCFFPSLPLGLALTSSSLVFAGLAIARTLTTWRADLVERRRRLRLFIVGASALYIGAIALLQLAGAPAGHETGLPNIAASLGLLAIAGIVAWSLLRVDTEQALFVAARLGVARPITADAEPVDKELLTALERSMAVDKTHRQEGLTIGGLAEKLGVPEYRLRRLINQALGYRNFNSFLNDHRIAEVKAALLDPTQAEVPVLTLALDAGFSSLGPFNRAFKTETGMTPSQFKRLGEKSSPIPESASHLPTSARRISPAP